MTDQSKGTLGDYVSLIAKGEANIKSREFEAAIEAFNAAIKMRPEMYEGYYKLGTAYMNTDQLLQAMQSFQEAYNRQPKELSLLLRISEICYRMHDYYRAAEMLTEVLIINDHYVPALCVLPELLVKIGRVDDALDLLKAALPAQPHIPELWVAAGIAAQAKGEPEKAKIFYQEALSLNPDQDVAKNNLRVLEEQSAA